MFEFFAYREVTRRTSAREQLPTGWTGLPAVWRERAAWQRSDRAEEVPRNAGGVTVEKRAPPERRNRQGAPRARPTRPGREEARRDRPLLRTGFVGHEGLWRKEAATWPATHGQLERLPSRRADSFVTAMPTLGCTTAPRAVCAALGYAELGPVRYSESA